MFKLVVFIAIGFVIYFYTKEYFKKLHEDKKVLAITDANAPKEVIPVFFATDDNYLPFAAVAIKSLLDNASKDYMYKIYILATELNEENVSKVQSLSTDYATIEIVNVCNELDKISGMLHMRDYYSNATYYRFFISRLFPQYDKVIYLDCDIVVKGDISQMYHEDISNYMVAAVQDEIISQTPIFVEYVEKVLDIKDENYFNAGILLINAKAFRDEEIESKFVSLLNLYKFTVDQDQGYLNVLCKNKVKFLDLGWNKGAYKSEGFSESDLKIVHYKMQWRPWHFKNVDFENYFWDYAKMTPFFDYIQNVLDTYTDEQRERDLNGGKKLLDLAYTEVHRPDNFMTLLVKYKKQSVMDAISDAIEDVKIQKLFNFIDKY